MDKSWFSKWFARAPKPDPNAAFTQAAQGDAEAQFGLGLKFALGSGVALDYGQAADWYRKAAEQNHCLAQFNLGMMYVRGQGMARDDAQSTQWFSKAALQGDAGAQYYMGESHHRASFVGSPKHAAESRIEAYKWFHLAAAQGYRGSDAAGAILLFKMTNEDVLAGDQRVAAFVAAKS